LLLIHWGNLGLRGEGCAGLLIVKWLGRAQGHTAVKWLGRSLLVVLLWLLGRLAVELLGRLLLVDRCLLLAKGALFLIGIKGLLWGRRGDGDRLEVILAKGVAVLAVRRRRRGKGSLSMLLDRGAHVYFFGGGWGIDVRSR